MLLFFHPGISANAPDPNTYTPMFVPRFASFPPSPPFVSSSLSLLLRLPRHAAASYDQRDVLAYLLSQGGLINVTDQDGDTPLYTVESVEGARWLIEHGAEPTWKNGEGLSVSNFVVEVCSCCTVKETREGTNDRAHLSSSSSSASARRSPSRRFPSRRILPPNYYQRTCSHPICFRHHRRGR